MVRGFCVGEGVSGGAGVGGSLEDGGGGGGGEEGFSGDSFRRKSRRAGSRWLRGSEGLSAPLEEDDPQNQPIVVWN